MSFNAHRSSVWEWQVYNKTFHFIIEINEYEDSKKKSLISKAADTILLT